MKEIKYLKIEQLLDFPKQEEIYGPLIVEPEFIASIKDIGIITPLIVTPKDNSNTYTIVSGHRRHKAAQKAGLEHLPCIIKNYENEEMIELEFLASNMQREKTKQARIKEFLRYKQILCQIGKVRKSKGIYADTIFENEQFSRILKLYKIDELIEPGEPLDSVAILKEITNFSEYEQTMLNILYSDDWLQNIYDEFRAKGVAESTLEEIAKTRDTLRSRYETEEISLNEAVKTMKNIIADIRKQLQKLEQAKTKKTEKTEKIKKTEKTEKPKPTLAIAVEPNNPIIYFDTKKEIKFGYEIDENNKIRRLIAEIKGKTYALNLEIIAQILKGAI